ncbi:hypothetical protein A0H76_3048 [Hepatospora eriocheir]|uniref:Uncharacterized protein n=1 Tax=Hepatospora eriocheir TaxID=1081669 RepID=A0A1X0QF47_9MICR|nr:hypothetical protein A0H76_3048 [Hepatospora eriocheir]
MILMLLPLAALILMSGSKTFIPIKNFEFIIEMSAPVSTNA